MLKRVHIKGYKSLSDVEVRLSPLTLLFGPNAAGKSNFLDALQLLSKLATRLGPTQYIVTTHSPILPDLLSERFPVLGAVH